MTPENFCYWLKGFFEMQTPKRPEAIPLNVEQSKMIEEHLDLVFKPKVEMPPPPPKVEDLWAIRAGDAGTIVGPGIGKIC